jgi:thioredoxin-related protein
MTSISAVELKPESIQADLVNPGYQEKPDWFKQSFLDLREDIQDATKNNKRVLLYFYQDGCPYCAKLLQDNLGQKKIADKTRNHFDVIALNMWGDREVTDLTGMTMTEKQFAEKLKVMYTPTLIFITEEGQSALRVNGYYAPHKFETALDFVAGKHEKTTSFLDYSRKHALKAVSGQLHAQPFILSPPYNLQKLMKMDKLLLVLFEQKQCKDCDEFHNDIFKRKETVKEINKFNVVRLDMWSNDKLVGFHGETVTAKALAKKLNISNAPSFVFFDKAGKDVFRIDAYLKAFHTQSVMDYISSGAYQTQPNFQRFISARADKLEAQGVHVNLMD